ncbi:nuclear transport factor 2 family protein [Flavobacterium yafengii]|uniref:nuclear transport factor 2 family protein n=1 Tax=Flavobacterium yafengii TaxID=3041253 RepID=UPI0024A9A3FE|nr:nuclear transport factor 2 family protein [Flavobacterium yafengii]MDI6045813.1 nuclear transport factor 2 family protein [Flavobacterium yafengii]
MKKILAVLIVITLSGCKTMMENQTVSKANINSTLDAWHKAAAEANYDAYFSLMADDAIFIGTDATENWNKKDFQAYAKPHFDKGKAWSFTALERHIYFDETGKTAWFDELLNTQMKICRGSGVLVKIGKEWKIKHYVLSMTIPNDNSNEVIKVKASLEDVMIKTLKSKQ